MLGTHARARTLRILIAAAVAGVSLAATHLASAGPPNALVVSGRIVATGIPGASAISAVGTFHTGGPIHDDPHFAALTTPGQVLDPQRILVASSSNFGAPAARADVPTGAILSLDPTASEPLPVPADFATTDGQVSALDGAVQLLTAASPAFLNSANNGGAVTADLPSVSGPQAISINNGFGRLWFGNAAQGAYAAGSESIADADGRPLAGAPDKRAGGIFVGALTNRAPEQRITGALAGTIVGTALMGKSPDGSGRAVFAAVSDDGSLVQIHTEQGLDGLSPPGTITPLPTPAADQLPLRAGVLFNWVPNPTLYIADPLANQVVQLHLWDDGVVFRVDHIERLSAPELSTPIDLAPAVPEGASPNFSSNTTLAGGSDLYVANRGNGTIVRMRQDGSVVAVASIDVPGLGVLGGDRLNGIATSPDAQHLWVTVSGPLFDGGSVTDEGAVVELATFGASTATAPESDSTGTNGSSSSVVATGQALFATEFTPEDGLGPLFNARSCLSCHQSPAPGGMGAGGLGTVLRVGRLGSGGFDPLIGEGGPVARAHSAAELGVSNCALQAGIPPSANVTSVRNAPALFGVGALDAIADQQILTGAISYPDGVHGRPNLIRGSDGVERIGRFGWKADTPTLEEFVAGAFRTELGITNPLAPDDLLPTTSDCSWRSLRDDGWRVAAVTTFVASLDPPPPPLDTDLRGQTMFSEIGCAECHTPEMVLGGQVLHPYTDLLLHDMGPALDDGVVQAQASGREWRTTPLWGLSQRVRFLHDGRARTINDAMSAHGGEADAARQRYASLSDNDRAAVIRFLSSL